MKSATMTGLIAIYVFGYSLLELSNAACVLSTRTPLVYLEPGGEMKLATEGLDSLKCASGKLQEIVAVSGSASGNSQMILASALAAADLHAIDSWPIIEHENDALKHGIDVILTKARHGGKLAAILDVKSVTDAGDPEVASKLHAIAAAVASQTVWVAQGILGASDIDLLESVSLVSESFRLTLSSSAQSAVTSYKRNLELVVQRSVIEASSHETERDDIDFAVQSIRSRSIAGQPPQLPVIFQGRVSATFQENGWPVASPESRSSSSSSESEPTHGHVFPSGAVVSPGYADGMRLLQERIGLRAGISKSSEQRVIEQQLVQQLVLVNVDAVVVALQESVGHLKTKSLLDATGELLEEWSALHGSTLAASQETLLQVITNISHELENAINGAARAAMGNIFDSAQPTLVSEIATQYNARTQGLLESYYASVAGVELDTGGIVGGGGRGPGDLPSVLVSAAVHAAIVQVQRIKVNLLSLARDKVIAYTDRFRDKLISGANTKLGLSTGAANAPIKPLSEIRRLLTAAKAFVTSKAVLLDGLLPNDGIEELILDANQALDQSWQAYGTKVERTVIDRFSKETDARLTKAWNGLASALDSAHLKGKHSSSGFRATKQEGSQPDGGKGGRVQLVDVVAPTTIVTAVNHHLKETPGLDALAQERVQEFFDVPAGGSDSAPGEEDMETRLKKYVYTALLAKTEGHRDYADELKRQNDAQIVTRMGEAAAAATLKVQESVQSIARKTIDLSAAGSIASDAVQAGLQTMREHLGELTDAHFPDLVARIETWTSAASKEGLSLASGAIGTRRRGVLDALVTGAGTDDLIRSYAKSFAGSFEDCVNHIDHSVFQTDAKIRSTIQRQLSKSGFNGEYTAITKEMLKGDVVKTHCDEAAARHSWAFKLKVGLLLTCAIIIAGIGAYIWGTSGVPAVAKTSQAVANGDGGRKAGRSSKRKKK